MKNGLSLYQRTGYGIFQMLDHFLGRQRVQKVLSGPRHKHFLKMKSTLEKGEKGRVIEVDRRKNLGLEEFKRDYLGKGKPVIMEGQAADWACCKNWDFDYLAQQYGEDKILMVDTVNPELKHQSISLSEAISKLGDSEENYIRFYNLIERHPERIHDFDFKWMTQMRHQRIISQAWQVFIGAKGNSTHIHNAPAGNLFVMVHGEKSWMMHPMSSAAFIDPRSTESGMYRTGPWRNGSPYNPFKPDFVGHPLCEFMDSYHVKLYPGDVLYNPPYWWHTVRNDTNSIGIGYRWINMGYNLKHHPLYAFLDLTARNPPFFKSLKLWNSTVNKVFLAEKNRLTKDLEKDA